MHGDTVNTAARVTSESFRERILATRVAANQFSEDLSKLVRPWRSVSLKGKEAEVELVELTWREGARTGTVAAPSAGGRGRQALRITLLCGGREFVLERGGKPIKFGRADANDIVIDDPTTYVSGSHGQVEFRGGAIEVVDTSRNGIYVGFANEQFFLVDKRLALRASGRMTLGRPPNDPQAISIEFKLLYARATQPLRRCEHSVYHGYAAFRTLAEEQLCASGEHRQIRGATGR